MPDDADYAALFSDSPTDQQKALVSALRGQQRQAAQMAALGPNPGEAPGMVQQQAGQGFQMLSQQQQRGLERLRAERETAALENEIGHRQEQMELERQRVANEQAQRDVTNAHAAQELGLNERKFGAEEGHKHDALVEQLGKTLAPHAEFYSDLRQINDILKKHPEAPGMGPIAGRLPTVFTNDEGQQLRKLAGKLALSYDKATGGARAIQPELLERLGNITGLKETGTVTGLYQGLANLKRDADATLRAIVAGSPEDVARDYFAKNPGLPNPFGVKAAPAKDKNADAKAWLADPKNANDPRAAAIKKKLGL